MSARETVRCLGCGSDIASSSRFCPECGASMTLSDGAPTVDAPAATTPSHGGSTSGSASVGASAFTPASVSRVAVGSSSDAGGPGRFAPGVIFAGRYRVIGLLGRGGMGEVYRADDLTLDQPVALKFLPESVAADPDRLARFRNEVRIARQVSHPNICRVYDIGESAGLHYLTMEYVDGEDLVSLLRRIGRLPRDKALDIARQLCLGVAAAHEKGVLHRDLKPANVMLDADGKVRVTDFGLADLAANLDRADIRAGTPAYMAPEQLRGDAVSARSDIYSLGLVLYEVFTGKPVYRARTVAELSKLHREGTPTSPSTIIPDMDPAVERVILKCLERDPDDRPATALSVVMGLPGGDPLAAALAAGETPSPELVAAAGKTASVSGRLAGLLVAGIAILFVAHAALNGREALIRKVGPIRAPAVLVDRARDIIRDAGYGDHPGDTAHGLTLTSDFWAVPPGENPTERWTHAVEARPSTFRFWYRESPRQLIPYGASRTVSPGNPPQLVSGMSTVWLDPQGRLVGFEAVPPQAPIEDPTRAADWPRLFTAAGLDIDAFTPITPEWIPPEYADERLAWSGTYPDQSDVPIRIEAAAFQGRPVSFRVVAPWSRPERMLEAETPERFKVVEILTIVIVLGALVGGAFVTRRNLRLGRGDWRGAFRLSGLVFVCGMLDWILSADHPRAQEALFSGFLVALGQALFFAGFIWLLYMALEPYVRKNWPQRIVSWSRVMKGQLRDTLVGRDVLIGMLVGLASALISLLAVVLPRHVGLLGSTPNVLSSRTLLGLDGMLGFTCHTFNIGILNGLVFMFVPILLLLFVRRTWIAAVLFGLILTLLFGSSSGGDQRVTFLFGAVQAAFFIYVTLRFGLLTITTAFLVTFLIGSAPVFLDFSTWYAGSTVVVMLLFGALLLYGVRTALAGRPATGGAIGEH